MKGFSLLETLLAMTIVSVISVAAVYMLFLSLNLRDLTLTTTKTQESLRVFDRALREAVIGAKTVSGGGNSLFLNTDSQCWSFVYDAVSKNVKYSKITQTNCVVDPSPTNLFFPTTTKINSLTFSILPLSSGGRQIVMSGTVQTTLPFDVYSTSFSNTYINLID